MEITALKLEMDTRFSDLEKKIDRILSVLTGNDLDQDGGMIRKVKDIEDKVQNHENFKNKIIIIWATVATISVLVGAITGLLIAALNK